PCSRHDATARRGIRTRPNSTRQTVPKPSPETGRRTRHFWTGLTELAERLEASGSDIPASEIEAGMELHLPCLVKVGQATTDKRPSSRSCPKLPNDGLPHPPTVPSQRDESLSDSDSLLNPPWTSTLAANSGGPP